MYRLAVEHILWLKTCINLYLQLLSLVIRWLKHHCEVDRCIYASELLQRFRLGLLPKEKVLELMDEEIQGMPGCKKIMDELTVNWREFAEVTDVMKLPISFLPRSMFRVSVFL